MGDSTMLTMNWDLPFCNNTGNGSFGNIDICGGYIIANKYYISPDTTYNKLNEEGESNVSYDELTIALPFFYNVTDKTVTIKYTTNGSYADAATDQAKDIGNSNLLLLEVQIGDLSLNIPVIQYIQDSSSVYNNNLIARITASDKIYNGTLLINKIKINPNFSNGKKIDVNVYQRDYNDFTQSSPRYNYLKNIMTYEQGNKKWINVDNNAVKTFTDTGVKMKFSQNYRLFGYKFQGYDLPKNKLTLTSAYETWRPDEWVQATNYSVIIKPFMDFIVTPDRLEQYTGIDISGGDISNNKLYYSDSSGSYNELIISFIFYGPPYTVPGNEHEQLPSVRCIKNPSSDYLYVEDTSSYLQDSVSTDPSNNVLPPNFLLLDINIGDISLNVPITKFPGEILGSQSGNNEIEAKIQIDEDIFNRNYNGNIIINRIKINPDYFDDSDITRASVVLINDEIPPPYSEWVILGYDKNYPNREISMIFDNNSDGYTNNGNKFYITLPSLEKKNINMKTLYSAYINSDNPKFWLYYIPPYSYPPYNNNKNYIPVERSVIITDVGPKINRILGSTEVDKFLLWPTSTEIDSYLGGSRSEFPNFITKKMFDASDNKFYIEFDEDIICNNVDISLFFYGSLNPEPYTSSDISFKITPTYVSSVNNILSITLNDASLNEYNLNNKYINFKLMWGSTEIRNDLDNLYHSQEIKFILYNINELIIKNNISTPYKGSLISNMYPLPNLIISFNTFIDLNPDSSRLISYLQNIKKDKKNILLTTFTSTNEVVEDYVVSATIINNYQIKIPLSNQVLYDSYKKNKIIFKIPADIYRDKILFNYDELESLNNEINYDIYIIFSNKCECYSTKTNISGTQYWPFISAVKNNPGSSLSIASRYSTVIITNRNYKYTNNIQDINIFGKKVGGPQGYGKPLTNFK